MFFFYDWTFIILLPALMLAFYAQAKVTSTFNRYLRESSTSGVTGAQAARMILNANGLHDVPVELSSRGGLSDHYDPRTRTLRLSNQVYQSSSVAALGVAAHEVGHALQHAKGYVPLSIRNGLFPVASFGSQLAFPLFILGFIFAADSLMQLGIWFFLAALLFQVVTLPVEFNASGRAIQLLRNSGLITVGEETSKGCVKCSCFNYVAAVAMSAAQLLRLLILRDSRRR